MKHSAIVQNLREYELGFEIMDTQCKVKLFLMRAYYYCEDDVTNTNDLGTF